MAGVVCCPLQTLTQLVQTPPRCVPGRDRRVAFIKPRSQRSAPLQCIKTVVSNPWQLILITFKFQTSNIEAWIGSCVMNFTQDTHTHTTPPNVINLQCFIILPQGFGYSLLFY